MTKKMAHLLGFVQHGVMNHASTMWAHPQDEVGYSFAQPEYWRDLGRVMERGLFDAMFIADELAPTPRTRGPAMPWSSTRRSSPCTTRRRSSPSSGLARAFLRDALAPAPTRAVAGRLIRAGARVRVQTRRVDLRDLPHREDHACLRRRHPGARRPPRARPLAAQANLRMQTVVDRSRDRAVEKYEEFRSLIRIESALAIVSGHTGVDFSTLGLDDNVADVDRRASAASSTPSCRRTTASRSPYGRQLSCTAWQWALPPQ
jgi:hypothetical protein